MKKIYKAILIIGIFAVIVSPVLGKTGGIKVDSDAQCDSPNKEDNTIGDGSQGTCFPIIWLNLPKGDLGSYTCQICDSGVCQSCNNFGNELNNCFNGYFFTTFEAPSGSGVRTIVISDVSGNVGRDSFRLVEGGSCPD